LLLYFLDHGRFPTAVENSFFAPISPDIEREGSFGRGQPVCFLILAGGLYASIQDQRTIRGKFEILVFGTE